MENMENQVKKLIELMNSFAVEADKGVEKNNKSAYRRARVLSLEIEKEMKAFRKNSPK